MSPKRRRNNMVLPIGILTLGTGMFGCFLSYYILSFNSYNDGWGTDVSFNEDYLILALIGLFLAILGAFLLITHLKKKESKHILFGGLAAISVISLIYALFMVIKSYVKCLSTTPFYWGWFFVSLLLGLLSICLLKNKEAK